MKTMREITTLTYVDYKRTNTEEIVVNRELAHNKMDTMLCDYVLEGYEVTNTCRSDNKGNYLLMFEVCKDNIIKKVTLW